MGFNCGIIGLPNVGKSTIFKALTAAKAEIANYPFCTIEPNVGIVAVPDSRLDSLEKIYHPKKVTPTTVEVVDIAGLVKGASRGEGLGNKFLGHVREVDALLHVVRCFEDPEVVLSSDRVDPKEDIETIEIELKLVDLEILERRFQRIEKKARSGEKSEQKEREMLIALQDFLNKGQPLRRFPVREEERVLMEEYHLLTLKPMLYVANVSEYGSEAEKGYLSQLEEMTRLEGASVLTLSGKIEGELSDLSPQEKAEFIKELGLGQPGLNRLTQAAYQLLGLITFFTAGEEEVRAWTVARGTKAPQAAGKIHSDMEKGFIRAEVMGYQDFCMAGSAQAVKEKGLYRLEGKDYTIKDGDIIYFRFNV